MASIKSKKFFAPQFMPGDGCGVVNNDVASVTALSNNDTIEFPWPAGLELNELKFQFDDLDSTSAQAFQAGYAPVQADTQYTQNLTYFAGASAITISRTGGRHECAFKPIKFDEDMKIVLTCNAAGTLTAGEVYAILVGAARGIRGS